MCGKSCQVRKKAAVTSIFQVGWPYKIMQNSKVLALKYRPQNLNELVGQEIVAETIYNSIKSNKIPNAFLFTGIRGVGKTTIARIIAKSLNCNYQIDDASKKIHASALIASLLQIQIILMFWRWMQQAKLV